jgi:hypothetical protein
VCLVDCFYEGANMLVIHPDADTWLDKPDRLFELKPDPASN